MKVYKDTHGRWVADIRFHGKGERKYCSTKGEADDYLKQRQRSRRVRPTDRPTLEVLRARLLDRRRGTCAVATLDVYRTQLAHIVAFPVRPGVLLGACPVAVLADDPALAIDLLKWQAGRGYSANSLRLLRNVLHELLERAVADGYLTTNPLQDARVRRDLRGLFATTRDARPEKVRALSDADAARFLATAATASRLYPFFAVGFGCGPRLGELVALRLEDDVVRPVSGSLRRQLHICRTLPHRASRRTPDPKRLKTGADYHVDVPTAVGAIRGLAPSG